MADAIFFDELIIWIESRKVPGLRLEDVAIKSGFSLWYLQRIFKKHTGITLGLYIKKSRMESARMDVLSEEHSIADISLKYGYESQQSFTRAFSRYYGMPPVTYRKIISRKHLSNNKALNES